MIRSAMDDDQWLKYHACTFKGFCEVDGHIFATMHMNGYDYLLTRNQLEQRKKYLYRMGWANNVTTLVLETWPRSTVKVVMTRKRRD